MVHANSLWSIGSEIRGYEKQTYYPASYQVLKKKLIMSLNYRVRLQTYEFIDGFLTLIKGLSTAQHEGRLT